LPATADASKFSAEICESDCEGGGDQPSGGVTCSIVPHFGQASNCPTAEALVTFKRAAHDLQMRENGCTGKPRRVNVVVYRTAT
jgi:hypothetical protein